MAKSLFTDKQIQNLKPEEKRYYLREGKGFAISVSPSGGKTWVYIYNFDGNKKYFNLGHYPDTSLADARKRCEDARTVLDSGRDPSQVKKDEKDLRRGMPTVEELFELFKTKYVGRNNRSRSERTKKEDDRIFKKDIQPIWGKRKIDSITRNEILTELEKKADTAKISARCMLERLRLLFDFAVDRKLIAQNPCISIKLEKNPPRERHLSEDEIKLFWDNIDKGYMSDRVKAALKIILITGQRPGEVIGMHTREIEKIFAKDEHKKKKVVGAWWTIPSERSKNGKSNRVYLTDLALDVIKEFYEPIQEGYIFESPKADKPMAVNAMAFAVWNNINRKSTEKTPGSKKSKTSTRTNLIGIPSFSPHDLRRTAATHLARLGFLDEVIDAILNHAKKGIIATYNLYRYDKEKQIALEAWSRELKSIVGIEVDKKDNVIPITRAAVSQD